MLLNSVWVKALKNSARNSSLLPRVSLNTKDLNSARFQFWRPGPRMLLNPRLPKAPATVGANADLSNQALTVFGYPTLPVTLGRLSALGMMLVIFPVPIR